MRNSNGERIKCAAVTCESDFSGGILKNKSVKFVIFHRLYLSPYRETYTLSPGRALSI